MTNHKRLIKSDVSNCPSFQKIKSYVEKLKKVLLGRAIMGA